MTPTCCASLQKSILIVCYNVNRESCILLSVAMYTEVSVAEIEERLGILGFQTSFVCFLLSFFFFQTTITVSECRGVKTPVAASQTSRLLFRPKSPVRDARFVWRSNTRSRQLPFLRRKTLKNKTKNRKNHFEIAFIL